MSESISDPTSVVANSESISTLIPSVVPPPKKFPALTLILLVLLLLTGTLVIYLFLQVRQLTLEKLAPSPTPIPSPSADPTAGWNNYHNDILSFRYDSDYTVKEMSVLNKNPEFSLSLEKDDLNIAVFNIYRKNSVYKTNDSPAHDLTVGQWISWNLYNNCEDKSFGVLSGKYCTSSPYSEKEYIFIAKYDDRFIEIVGKGNNQLIIDQVLSTFKFTNDLDQNSLYTCPQNGWQDCMPILSEEGQKACSDEAMDWYKSNCPDFQGAAL